jgi:hypothetical protein
MPELHSNGSYDPYIAQLFNSMGGGAQFNPALYGSTGANGIGGAWGIPGLAAQPQNPLAQNPWGFQNPLAALNPTVQQATNPVQSLVAIQVAQQIVAKQAAQAIQCAQALQAVLQQAFGQVTGAQGQVGLGQFGPSQYGQGPQQQTLQQLMQYLAMQQPAPFRYGLAA